MFLTRILTAAQNVENPEENKLHQVSGKWMGF
jgi:hypothetical protein